jgi:hypothetical protein
VPTIQIYLHAKFLIFLRSLSNFHRFIFPPVYLENSVEKEKEFLLLGPNSPCWPSPQRKAGPAPAPLSPTAASGPWSPCGPTSQPPSLYSGPACREFVPQMPCSVRRHPPGNSSLQHPVHSPSAPATTAPLLESSVCTPPRPTRPIVLPCGRPAALRHAVPVRMLPLPWTSSSVMKPHPASLAGPVVAAKSHRLGHRLAA